MKAGRKTTRPDDTQRTRAPRRANSEGGSRTGRARSGHSDARRDARRPHDPGAIRRAPQNAPVSRPVERPGRAKNADQAKARAKARKAKAPKVVRPPLRERIRARLLARLDGLDLRPRALLARIPFVVLVIGSLGIGLAITLWLSTDSAGRSYQLGSARALNEALTQQKEALERDVLQAESAPALADAARNLGMIPSRDTAHLVQDPVGNWVVVGQPTPAAGVSPPPLNTKLPDPKPPAPQTPAPRPPGGEVPTRIAPAGVPGAPGAEVAVRSPGPGGGSPVAPLIGPPVVGVPQPGLVLVPVPVPGADVPAADGLPAVPQLPGAGVEMPPPVPAEMPAPGVGQ